MSDIDCTMQDTIHYMVKRNDMNCFPAYLIDFTWKMIQVKMAFMVRNLSFKVKNDFKDKDIKTAETIKNANAVYEKQIVKLERTIQE